MQVGSFAVMMQQFGLKGFETLQIMHKGREHTQDLSYGANYQHAAACKFAEEFVNDKVSLPVSSISH